MQQLKSEKDQLQEHMFAMGIDYAHEDCLAKLRTIVDFIGYILARVIGVIAIYCVYIYIYNYIYIYTMISIEYGVGT